jgi:3-deoxy-D-manno-octulosonic-acid transferase
MTLVRRSQRVPCDSQTTVFLGDTMGELPVFFAAADAAFIGGSLVPTGGHNLLEAAAAGIPVAVGPHHFNFATITALLCEAGGAVEVPDGEALAALLIRWLGDADERARVGAAGRRVMDANRGALQRLKGILDEALLGREQG